MKSLAERVREQEQRLPELMAQLADQEPTARKAADQAARDARFTAGIDSALAVPLRPRLLRRAAAPIAGFAVAAGLLLAWSQLSSARRPHGLRIEGERFAAASASAMGGRPAALAPPPEAERTPTRAPTLRPPATNLSTSPAPQRAADPPPLAAPAESAEPHAGGIGTSSTLATEIQLFEASAQAERGGDIEGALTALDRLVALNPASPLAQQAMVRKFRTLARAQRRDEARRAADAYLQAFPDGFAQAEAKTITQAGE